MHRFASIGGRRFFARLLVALAVIIGAALVSPAGAGTVRNIITTGPSSNRLDIVILGDGYTSGELGKFATDATALANRFLNESPMFRYRNYFNVKRIDTPSATSGASHNGVPGNTYYGAYYNCFSVARLLCVDDARVSAELNATLQPNQRDIVLVVVNDPEYGGSGGQYAVTSIHPQAPEVAIHELGHSFGHLDDEYEDAFNCGRYTNPYGFNVTQATARASVPWTRWIPPTTVVPTPPGGTGVGLYQGAFFCSTGWYRPTPDSKMRSLGQPFFQVSAEQIVRRMYEFVSTVDWVLPTPGTLRIAPGTNRTFVLRTISPTSTTLTMAWRLNGVVVSTTDRVTITAAQLAGANKTLTLAVQDRSPIVRYDPSSLLIDRFQWTLTP